MVTRARLELKRVFILSLANDSEPGCNISFLLAMRSRPVGCASGVWLQSIGNAIARYLIEETLSKIGELTFADAAYVEKRVG